MKREFNFGKIAYASKRRTNTVTVRVELKTDEDNRRCFSASGHIWNSTKTDYVVAGQCLDTIKEYIDNSTFNAIYRLWKQYHLNNIRAGTPEQEKAVSAWLESTKSHYDYKEVCEYLKSINLYEVEYEGKPYKYGQAWLYHAIPDEDLKEIENLIQNETEHTV